MDFSPFNQRESDALNTAARNNDVKTVERLLKKLDPNCIDDWGWTCLHEAAENDSYESLMLILKHPDCRPMAETRHEGYTSLFLAVRRQCSTKTLIAILESADDIANYGCKKIYTPLHLASFTGNLETMQLLLDYGAMVNVQNDRGHTPLHEAVWTRKHDAVRLLLHAGADPEIRNEEDFTAFHLACDDKRGFESVRALYPFISDINQCTDGCLTPLMYATLNDNEKLVDFLLENGADPNLSNTHDDLALNKAQQFGQYTIFKKLLKVTDMDKINRDFVMDAFSNADIIQGNVYIYYFEILGDILNHDFGVEFFDFIEPFHMPEDHIEEWHPQYRTNAPFHMPEDHIEEWHPQYRTNAPLNSYLKICQYIYERNKEKFIEYFLLFLLRGVEVNALNVEECPPIVYIHYKANNECFVKVLELLIEYNCNIDYCSSSKCVDIDQCIPDTFLASLNADTTTITHMIPFSLRCEPERLLEFAYAKGLSGRILPHVQHLMLSMIDSDYKSKGITAETLPHYVRSLQHLCRLKIRSILKNKKPRIRHTNEYLDTIRKLELPPSIQNYLKYQCVL